MKKFLAKLALFTIISLILVSIGSISAYAAPEQAADKSGLAENLAKGLDELTYDFYCIKETLKDEKTPGPDDGYIITVIEEPLNLEEYFSPAGPYEKRTFEARICYRNYLSYVPEKGGEEVLSILATKCAEKIKSEFFSTEEYKELNVTTSCKPVQVFLSKGGTSLIINYISNIYMWAASLVGVIATAVIIISGIQISVAGGDTQAIDSAKGRIIKSISGIVVLFLSGLILYTINPNFFTQ